VKPAFFLLTLLLFTNVALAANTAWNNISVVYTTSWYPAPSGYAVQIALRFTFDSNVYNPRETRLIVKLYDENNTQVGQTINKTFYELWWPNEYGQVNIGDSVQKTGTYRYHVVVLIVNKLYGELRLDFYPTIDVGKNSNDNGWEPIYPQPEPVPTPREPITNPVTNTSTQEQLAVPSLTESNKLLAAAIGVAVLVIVAAVVVARW